jgi:large subunit ribosomal protein L4
VQVAVHNLVGKEVGQVELDDYIFGITPNIAVIQQAVLRQQANARQGTHNTKTRADVRGGGRKPWRQKGTGRARQGSTRSPQWAHGGVVFGPHTRSYEQDMPRKMRRLAIRGVLSAKAAENQIVVVENFEDLEPRTKAMKETLASLNVGESSALIMTAEQDETLEKAAGNLERVKTMPVSIFSVVDMLKFDYLVLPQASLDIITSILGNTGGRRKISQVESASAEESAKPARKTKPSKPSAKTTAKAAAEEETETKIETKTKTKSEAKSEAKSTATKVTPKKAPAKKAPAKKTPAAKAAASDGETAKTTRKSAASSTTAKPKARASKSDKSDKASTDKGSEEA